MAALALAACGPTARIPQRPVPVPNARDGRLMVPQLGEIPGPADPARTQLARTLAPVLYLHRHEPFALARAVAVMHPTERIIAYHLLWEDDAYGAWIPRTMATDEEIVWVGYDRTGAPTRMWTYWHGVILQTPWSGRQVEVDVQWGKHGSLPRGVLEETLPRGRSLKSFYRMTFALPDLWLGNITRPGPWCFCRTYASYRSFTEPRLLGSQLDAIVVTADPRSALSLVFGTPYSNKPWWPWSVSPNAAPRVDVIAKTPADSTER